MKLGSIWPDEFLDRKFSIKNIKTRVFHCIHERVVLPPPPPHTHTPLKRNLGVCVLYVREMFPDITKSCVLFEFINTSHIFGILTYKFK